MTTAAGPSEVGGSSGAADRVRSGQPPGRGIGGVLRFGSRRFAGSRRLALKDRFARAMLAAMPLLAIALLAALISVLLWYVDREERERVHASLLTDALWVEQTLRFQLGTDEDAIARLALDSGRASLSDDALLAHARQILANNPEIASITWFSTDGTVRLAMPPVAELPQGLARASIVRRGIEGSMRPVYAMPRSGEGGTVLVDMATPVAGGTQRGQVIVATFAADALLARHVPWWIAEKYDVRLVDADGEVIAAKSRTRRGDETRAHGISFDPPIPGASLQIAPHSKPASRTNTLLIAAIFGLAALAMVSLVLAHRHVRKRLDAESALRAESAFRKAMEDSLTVGMRARDLEGRIIYVNSAFCRMLGVERDDLIGRAPPMPYWDPDDLEHTRAIHDRVLAGDAPAQGFELKFRRSDGTLLDVLIYEAPLIDAQGRHAGWMASVLDITGRKRAEDMAKAQEASLQRTARLVTMGEMASTLAHELNQPLAAIASYGAGCLNLIRSEKADPPMLTEALEKLGVQAKRAGLIIRRVHDFVRKSDPKIVATSVEQLVSESAAFAEADLRKHGVRMEIDLASDLPMVLADPILMQQVLLNLIRNGAEAMAGIGRDGRLLRITAGMLGESVEITVEDRGPGLAEHLEHRLFEPFVTTKADGMGMGLNICRSIVELHKGRLSFTSPASGGLRFSVTLPSARLVELAS
jgi:two-component system, LuxR family, sensor histidine kinase DctS